MVYWFKQYWFIFFNPSTTGKRLATLCWLICHFFCLLFFFNTRWWLSIPNNQFNLQKALDLVAVFFFFLIRPKDKSFQQNWIVWSINMVAISLPGSTNTATGISCEKQVIDDGVTNNHYYWLFGGGNINGSKAVFNSFCQTLMLSESCGYRCIFDCLTTWQLFG